MRDQMTATGKENLTQKIYDDLLRRFLNNELLPGTVIDRKALAKEYSVSMSPVRDALQRLALEGFVETRSRSITIVKVIKKEDIYDMLTVREALESQVTRMICGERIRSEYDALMILARQVDEADAIMEYWRKDIAFHRQLVTMSGCKLLITMYNQIMNIGNFYQINNFFVNLDPESRDSHITLLQHLASDDKDESELAIRNHLKAGKIGFPQYIRK
ncbi:MAG: GntR family transcriptional regulator [Clostridiales bacterium]|nr:GntR family transcriptional regulator [Clostridiales bacterium]